MINKKRLLDNFLKYVKVDTQSIEGVDKIPSSPGQLELAKIVAEDLKRAGVHDIKLEEQGYLFGTIPSNIDSDKVPTVAYVAHFDTCSETSGVGVKPRIIENYKGQKIDYPANNDISLTVEDDQELKTCFGHTILVSDGTTVLGADDKAGIAEIVEMAYYFKENPDKKHGKIRIAIMPDEEVTTGSHNLNLKLLETDVAYTIDSVGLGALDIESFNGYKGKISVTGTPAFPGYGKGVYLNAAKVLSDFVSLMPDKLWPQNAEGREGLWWVDDFKGGVGHAEMLVYLRDFDLDGIKKQQKILDNIKKDILKKYPEAKIDINISESYKNYKHELDKDKRIVEYAKDAIKRIGVEPTPISVRGGNDCCHFCFGGLLSTNIFAGFKLMHSLKEWVSLEVMEKAVENIVELSKVWMERTTNK